MPSPARARVRSRGRTRAARVLACALAVAALLALAGCTAEASRDTISPPPAAEVQTQPEGQAAPETDASPDAVVPPSAPAEKPVNPLEISLTQATVTRVVDGDTAHVRIAKDGRIEKVRFIGIDTPESTIEHEPYGEEASTYTKNRLSGKTVYLETDAELRDRYGRLLAYVWMSKPTEADADGSPTFAEVKRRMFDAWLVRDGYAQVLTIPPNVRYADDFLVLQRQAREAERGLWGLPVSNSQSGGGTKAPSTTSGAYVGNSNTMKFHLASCSSVGQMNPEHRVPYSTRQAAIQAGYVPCKRCNP